jgi:chemotaxis protein MotB
MARKKKHPEHVNHERWLVSYADFITLLFAFFTTLYAMSTVDQKKMSKLMESLSSALGSVGTTKTAIDPRMPNPWQQAGSQPDLPPGGSKRPDRALAELAQAMAKIANSFGGDARFQVRVEPRGVVLSLAEAALFGPGDTRLRRTGLPVLDSVVRLLLQNPHPLLIEGHTDDRTGVQPSANWRLSTDRAVTVLSYFVEEHGYPPGRLAASGYGQYHPVAKNDTEEGRSRNRRVDIIILREGNTPPDFQR